MVKKSKVVPRHAIKKCRGGRITPLILTSTHSYLGTTWKWVFSRESLNTHCSDTTSCYNTNACDTHLEGTQFEPQAGLGVHKSC